jgi:hypothetical protein
MIWRFLIADLGCIVAAQCMRLTPASRSATTFPMGHFSSPRSGVHSWVRFQVFLLGRRPNDRRLLMLAHVYRDRMDHRCVRWLGHIGRDGATFGIALLRPPTPYLDRPRYTGEYSRITHRIVEHRHQLINLAAAGQVVAEHSVNDVLHGQGVQKLNVAIDI